MRPARVILLYAVAVIGVGALLAPWLFWVVQWLAAHVEWLAGWERHPFRRIWNRSVQITALIGLWPLLRNIGYQSWTEVGFVRRSDWRQQLLFGVVIGVVSLALCAGVTGSTPAWNALTPKLAGQLVMTACAVGLFEEVFFRGALQGSLQRGMHWIAALVSASMVYSALHFLKPSMKILPADVTWTTGLLCLAQIVTKSFTSTEIMVAFLTLALAGGVMGVAFYRTAALYLPIGLHAGWVLANETVRALGGDSLVGDWRVWPVLLALLWWVNRWRPRTSPG